MYTGDIKTANNFEINVSKPIDNRLVKETLAEAEAIPFKYIGLKVYIVELGAFCYWNGLMFRLLIDEFVKAKFNEENSEIEWKIGSTRYSELILNKDVVSLLQRSTSNNYSGLIINVNTGEIILSNKIDQWNHSGIRITSSGIHIGSISGGGFFIENNNYITVDRWLRQSSGFFSNPRYIDESNSIHATSGYVKHKSINVVRFVANNSDLPPVAERGSQIFYNISTRYLIRNVSEEPSSWFNELPIPYHLYYDLESGRMYYATSDWIMAPVTFNDGFVLKKFDVATEDIEWKAGGVQNIRFKFNPTAANQNIYRCELVYQNGSNYASGLRLGNLYGYFQLFSKGPGTNEYGLFSDNGYLFFGDKIYPSLIYDVEERRIFFSEKHPRYSESLAAEVGNNDLNIASVGYVKSTVSEKIVKPSDLLYNYNNKWGTWIPATTDGNTDTWSIGIKAEYYQEGDSIPIRMTGGQLRSSDPVNSYDLVNLRTINTRLAAKADLIDGKVPVSQLPSYVSDVIVAGDYSLLPAIGEESKIYVTEDENKTYRWTGSAYVEIGDGGVVLGETSATAYRGDRGKTAYDHSQLTGNPHDTEIDNITGLRDELDSKLEEVLPSTLGISNINGIAFRSNTNTWQYSTVDILPANNTVARRTSTGSLRGAIATNNNDLVPLIQLTSELAIKADLIDGKIPVSQLPSYVSDVIVVEDYSLLPAVGEDSKIYVTEDENKTYRWTGSAYVEIGDGGVALGETSTTAYRGDRGKTAYDHSQLAHAPANAQKNSDITKAEIENKLTGAISSHNHNSQYHTKTESNNFLAAKADLVDGKVPISQLPSYVSDVIVVGNYSLLPATGEASKIYVTEDENKTYRWTGSTYVEIGDGGVVLGETSATAYRGDRGKTAYDHSQSAHAPVNAQKNSDITKAEIEAKLTGTISSHNHDTQYIKISESSSLSTPSTNVVRDAFGRFQSAAPASSNDVVNKQFLEDYTAAPATATIYYVDAVNGLDDRSCGTLNRPYKTLDYAHDRISGTGHFAGSPVQSSRTICLLNGTFTTERNLAFRHGSTSQLLTNIFYRIEASAKWEVGNTCPFQIDYSTLGNIATNLSIIGTSGDYAQGQGGIFLNGTAGFINITGLRADSTINKSYNIVIDSLTVYRNQETVDTVIRMVGTNGENGRALIIRNSGFSGVARLLTGDEQLNQQANNIYVEKCLFRCYNSTFNVSRAQNENNRFGYNILIGKGHTDRHNTNTDLATTIIENCLIAGSEQFALLGIAEQQGIIRLIGNQFTVARRDTSPRSRHHIVFLVNPASTNWLRRSGTQVTPGAYCVIDRNHHDGNHHSGHKLFAMNENDGTTYSGSILDVEMGYNMLLKPNSASGTNIGGTINNRAVDYTIPNA